MIKYYICSVCGNLVEKVVDGGTTPSCCNRTMKELAPGSTDGAVEKHVPVITQKKIDGNENICCVEIKVGEEAHPATSTHHIEWITLVTDKGIQRKKLLPEDEPKACFYIGAKDRVIEAFAYCNLHGLFVKKCC